jgi:chitin disaccharide deacetylase
MPALDKFSLPDGPRTTPGEPSSSRQDAPAGFVFINADDWGRNRETSNRILDCVVRGTVTSASAMVFMEDSERAAELARDHGIDAGLHLNFTTPFDSPRCSAALQEHHRKVMGYLRRHALARVLFNPWLANSFEYVGKAQLEEFARRYGGAPGRLDGHHHMHLCANVQHGNLFPEGTMIRRNFSFEPGEKSLLNRMYRKNLDARLAKRHSMADYFYSLSPLEPIERLQKVFALAQDSVVEVETHPVEVSEYRFLTGPAIERLIAGVRLTTPSTMRAAALSARTVH